MCIYKMYFIGFWRFVSKSYRYNKYENRRVYKKRSSHRAISTLYNAIQR